MKTNHPDNPFDPSQFNCEQLCNQMTEYIQKQTENMTQKMIDQATWLPEEGKKAIDEWLATYKKGREDFKKLVDDAFGKVLQSF